MSIIKRAFMEGLQRSLVASGAIPPYSSKWQAKHALDQAEKKENVRKADRDEEQKLEDKTLGKTPKEPKPEDPKKDMSEEQVAEIMSDIVNAPALDEAIEALQDYQETANDSEEAADDLSTALEDLKDSKEAAYAIRRLKQANAVGAGRKGNEGLKGRDMEIGETTDYPMPKDLRVDQLEPHYDISPNKDGQNVGVLTSKMKDKVSKKQVKHALHILRKLAGEQAVVPPAQQNLGDHEEDYRDPEYAAANPVRNAHPVEPDTTILDHPGKVSLAHLVAKTAQEVGHFLPTELTSSDKLAALRTMVGMNGQERAAYIGRIKEAMYQGSPQDQEAQASQVLRNLGL